MNNRVSEGALLKNHSRTLLAMSQTWLAEHGQSIKNSTRDDYEHRLERHVLPSLGSRRVHDLSSTDFTWLWQKMVEIGYSPTTVIGTRRVCNQLMNYAVRAGLRQNNPVQASIPPKKNKARRILWTPEEARSAISGSANDTRLQLFLTLALSLGLRKGEILALRRDDVDLSTGVLSISKRIYVVRNRSGDSGPRWRAELDSPKTAQSERSLKLSPVASRLVAKHIRGMNDAQLASGLLFCSSKGSPWSSSNLYVQFRRLQTNNGLPSIRIHDLRHSTAVIALEGGLRIEALSQALGHARIDTTKSIYAPYVQALHDEFSSAMGEALYLEVQD
jgi:integrase